MFSFGSSGTCGEELKTFLSCPYRFLARIMRRVTSWSWEPSASKIEAKYLKIEESILQGITFTSDVRTVFLYRISVLVSLIYCTGSNSYVISFLYRLTPLLTLQSLIYCTSLVSQGDSIQAWILTLTSQWVIYDTGLSSYLLIESSILYSLELYPFLV